MSQLLRFWTFDLVSLLVMAGLVGLYGYLAGGRLRPGAGYYGAGLLLLGLVQFSPLHMLGTHYLLSAHMVGHMLLLLVVAPLLVWGLPNEGPAPARLGAVAAWWATYPWLGWLIGLGTMWFWHIPAVYDATIASPVAYGDIESIPLCTVAGTSGSGLANLLHSVQPVSLVLAGVCFVWPVIGPLPSARLAPLKGVVYLFTACVGCSLLGMLITFAPVGVYQPFAGADYYGIAGQLRRQWGFDPATDQQTAGLLMWVPGCLLYLTGALWLLRNELLGTYPPEPPTQHHVPQYPLTLNNIR